MLRLLVPAFLLGFGQCEAADVLTPVEMQKKMGFGINLGNRLDLWEQSAKEVKEAYFDQYKEKGFTNVRIPVCWHMHTSETAPYTINATFLDSVEQYVDWSLARGMVTILNTHHEKWLDDSSKFKAGLPRFQAMWTQIAERFAAKDQTLLFEMFNEPHLMTTSDLNAMYSAVFPIIRKTNPTRIVLFMGLKFGNPSWIMQNPTGLQIPDDKQIMLEIHNYDPFKYAGSSPSQHSWGSASDRKALTHWMDGIDAWAKQKQLPIYYGEFGITNVQTAATGRDDWLKAHYAEITTRGWGASVWNDGGGHLIFDYTTLSWVEDILRDLGRNATPGPPSPPSPPSPPPTPSPPTPAGGPCCHGGSSKNCFEATKCPAASAKPFCAASQTNCEDHCGGVWCPHQTRELNQWKSSGSPWEAEWKPNSLVV